jgi:hypothetical protein
MGDGEGSNEGGLLGNALGVSEGELVGVELGKLVGDFVRRSGNDAVTDTIPVIAGIVDKNTEENDALSSVVAIAIVYSVGVSPSMSTRPTSNETVQMYP